MSMLTGDLKAALRAIERAPAVPATVVTLTALGLGLSLGMWAIVDAAFLRPLPLPDPSALVVVWETHAERGRMSVAAGNFLDWAPRARSFAAVGGQQAIDATLGSGGAAQRLSGAKVTATYFDVWQVPPLRGRVLVADDFRSDAHVVVLSARVWQQTFGASETLVGSVVRVDGQPFTVVGIMPPESSVVGRLDVWMPWVFTDRQRTERRFHEVGTFARLRLGVKTEQASAELASTYATLAAEHPDTTHGWSAAAAPLRTAIVDVPTDAVRLLTAAVLTTFAVAVANIVGLLGGWWPRRRLELVTRRALGAGTGALVRQLLVEGVLMAGTGAVAGGWFAHLFIDAFGQAVAPSSLWFSIEPRLDARAAVAATCLFAGVVLIALVLPAWRLASAVDLVPRRMRQRSPLSSVGIALQVAAAVVLLAAAATLLRSARHLLTLVPGDGTTRLAVEVSLSDERYPTEEAQRTFFSRLLEALRAQPDVAKATATSYVPPTNALGNMRFDIDGRPSPAEARSAAMASVDDDAFRMLGVRLLKGRLFDARDTVTSPPALVISEALARRHWGDDDPLGSAVRFVGVDAPLTVVGVVSDVRRPLSDDPRAETVVYLNRRQAPWPFMTVLLEPRGDPAATLSSLRRVLAGIDADQSTGPVRTLTDLQAEWLAQPRVQSALVTLFGASTVLLTLAGIYARMSFAATERRRECAVRAAIGATPARVTWSLTSPVVVAAGAGLLTGLAALPPLAGALGRIAYEASPMDGSTVAGIAALVILSVLSACYIPARLVRGQNLADVLRTD